MRSRTSAAARYGRGDALSDPGGGRFRGWGSGGRVREKRNRKGGGTAQTPIPGPARRAPSPSMSDTPATPRATRGAAAGHRRRGVGGRARFLLTTRAFASTKRTKQTKWTFVNFVTVADGDLRGDRPVN